MSNNAIGTGAIILTANADGVEPGLNKASSKLSKWANSAGKIADKAGGGKALMSGMLGGMAGGAMAGGALSGIGSGIGFALGGPIGAGIGSALGGGLANSIGSITTGFAELTEKADSASKKARSLGTSTESLMGLQHAANLSGISADQLDVAFGKLRKQTTGPFDEALAKAADRIAGITDPGKKAEAAVAAFGKAGIDLLPMLEQGSAGLEAMKAEAKALGITFDDIEAGKLEEANDAMTRVSASVEGMKTRFMLMLAPVIEKIANGLAGGLKMIQPLIRWIGEAADTYFTVWSAILDEVWIVVKDVASSIWDWIKATFKLGDSTMSAKEMVLKSMRLIATGAAYVWDTLKLGSGVILQVAGHLVDGFGTVIDSLKNVVDLASGLPDALKPAWVDGLAGGLDEASAKADEISGKMKKWGKDAVDGFGESAGKVGRFFDKLEGPGFWGRLGKIKAPKVTGGEGVDLTPKGETKFAGAIEQGTKEAYALIVRYQTGGMFKSDDTPKRQLGVLEKMDAKLGKLVDAEKDEVI